MCRLCVVRDSQLVGMRNGCGLLLRLQSKQSKIKIDGRVLVNVLAVPGPTTFKVCPALLRSRWCCRSRCRGRAGSTR